MTSKEDAAVALFLNMTSKGGAASVLFHNMHTFFFGSDYRFFLLFFLGTIFKMSGGDLYHILFFCSGCCFFVVFVTTFLNKKNDISEEKKRHFSKCSKCLIFSHKLNKNSKIHLQANFC